MVLRFYVIYGSDRAEGTAGGATGVQCKVHNDGASLTTTEVDAEVAKADAFVPNLASYIIATTASRDANVQRHVRSLSDRRKRQGLFPVEVLFWEDIVSRLARHPDILRRHFAEFFHNASAATSQDADGLAATFAVITAAGSSSTDAQGVGTVDRPELASFELALSRGSVLLFGRGGTGKSGLATQVARRATARGDAVLLISGASLSGNGTRRPR